jgi:hypothetical protein
MAKLPTSAEIDAATVAFESYFSGLGKVAHAWNHMQEELGKLFTQLSGLDLSMGMTIWHSLRSDLAQRQMLKAVTEHHGSDDDWTKTHPKAEAAVVSLVNDINAFSTKRNAAIHAPCNQVLGGDDLEIIAVTFFGNPNAKKLREAEVLQGADNLTQFAWFERTADAYRRYVKELEYALSEPRTPWPDKPRMPTLGEKNTPQDHPPGQT